MENLNLRDRARGEEYIKGNQPRLLKGHKKELISCQLDQVKDDYNKL